MRREVEHFRRIVKAVLNAVAVVNIEIHQQNARQAVLGHGVRGGEGGIIEDAKAHRPVRRRVMPGRPDQRKGRLHTADHHGIDSPHRGPGSGNGGGPTARGSHRIPRVKIPAACSDDSFYSVQISRRVDTLDLRPRRRSDRQAC